MDPLLRQYETWECLGDGYPEAWHNRTQLLHPRPPNYPYEMVPAIKDLIREYCGHRCLRCGHPYRAGDPAISERGEWSPCDEHCTHLGIGRWETKDGIQVQAGLPDAPWSVLLLQDPSIAKVESQWRILTVHHLDEDKRNCRWWNLAALCQRCHLRMQRAVVMDRVYSFEHSEWFKPYAAGFYAFKYLDEDLSREETMSRLDELLALEHRFTQEAIF